MLIQRAIRFFLFLQIFLQNHLYRLFIGHLALEGTSHLFLLAFLRPAVGAASLASKRRVRRPRSANQKKTQRKHRAPQPRSQVLTRRRAAARCGRTWERRPATRAAGKRGRHWERTRQGGQWSPRARAGREDQHSADAHRRPRLS